MLFLENISRPAKILFSGGKDFPKIITCLKGANKVTIFSFILYILKERKSHIVKFVKLSRKLLLKTLKFNIRKPRKSEMFQYLLRLLIG